MTSTKRRHIVMTAAALAVAVMVVWIYASFDPTVDRFFPRCMFKVATGWDCPGCGSQRAIHAILTGRFGEAWHYNAILFPSLGVIILVVLSRLFPRRLERLRRFLGSQAFILAVFGIFVLWTILRNVVSF